MVLRILPPLLTAAGYAAVYKLWQLLYPNDYTGLTFYLDEPFYSLRVIWEFSLSFLPLHEMAAISGETPVGADELLRSITVGSLVKAAAVTALFVWTVHEVAPKLRFHGFLVLSLAGLLAPNLLIGFSEKYVQTCKNGIRTYIPSFYSYFFLVVLICGGSCLLYRRLRQKNLQVLYLILLGTAVCLTSLMSDFCVDYWKQHYAVLDRRYQNFDRAVSSRSVADCDAGWQIYAPENAGIHYVERYTLDYIALYDDTPAGGYVFQADKVDSGKRLLCLRSDAQYLLMAEGEMQPDFTAAELRVVTALPEQFDVVLHTASGAAVSFTQVTDGTVLHCPEGDAFDMRSPVEAAVHSDG